MTTIQILDSDLIYKNPKPHVSSVHAYFPSVVRLPDGQMLATVALAEAFEAPNMHTNVCRSTDNGKTWRLQGPIYPGTPDRLTSDAARLTVTPDGRVICFMVRADRSDHPDEGLTNPDTLGFVPTELLLLRSTDLGKSWSRPAPLVPPLEGPSFELCSPITILRDGRWILPTLTWPGWSGHCPNGVKMVALVSHDRGKTWPEYWDVMNEPEGRVYFWESKIVEMTDGRLLAVAWTYDDVASKDRLNHYAVSKDSGKTWSRPAPTGLMGQTMTPLLLDDDRILCVYRRMDQPGLWANLAHLEQDLWINDDDAPLWGHNTAGLTATTEDMAHNFNVLRFGAPSLTTLPDNTVFLAFWCYEDCISVIRWFKLRV
ncbi:MAG: exo-alpha-sialidase [Phycisphaerae bacterium]|nr:exo-alpha-sialidase [Phycisphaerae bacterium]